MVHGDWLGRNSRHDVLAEIIPAPLSFCCCHLVLEYLIVELLRRTVYNSWASPSLKSPLLSNCYHLRTEPSRVPLVRWVLLTLWWCVVKLWKSWRFCDWILPQLALIKCSASLVNWSNKRCCSTRRLVFILSLVRNGQSFLGRIELFAEKIIKEFELYMASEKRILTVRSLYLLFELLYSLCMIYLICFSYWYPCISHSFVTISGLFL